MPTPKDGYHLKDGTPVPRTTEIIDAFDPKYGLRDWIWNQGRLGIDYKTVRDAAGDVGTAVHAMIQAYINGATNFEGFHEKLSAEQSYSVGLAFGAFTRWVRKKEIEWLETEVELVSEKYRYGGTLDAVGVIEGGLVLCDWKTSDAYPRHLLQLAAYRQLWNENRERPINTTILVRLSKTDATFEPYTFSNLDGAWQLFLHHRQAFEEIDNVATALREARRCMKLEKSREKSSGG